MATPAEVLNELFAQRIESPEGREKIAQYAGTFVRDRLREDMFTSKVIPEEPVTPAECQRSVNHDTLVKIVDIEPKSRAMAITFRGNPTVRYIRGPRYEIPFFPISSEKFEKAEEELLAYESPITKIIEDNAVSDIGDIYDREFLRHCESAVQEMQKEGNGGTAKKLNAKEIKDGTVKEASIVKGELARTFVDAAGAFVNDATIHPVQKSDLGRVFRLFPGKGTVGEGSRLRATTFLVSEWDYEDINDWTLEVVGSQLESEIAVDGWKANQIRGKKFIRTVKTDVLRPGNVYAYTAPEFLGKNYVLNQVKFYIDKIANRILFQAWRTGGMGIGNIASVKKLELYSGSVTPAPNDDATMGAVQPNAEEDLGAENNKADKKLTFPQVKAF